MTLSLISWERVGVGGKWKEAPNELQVHTNRV